jgi:hypothetical protein
MGIKTINQKQFQHNFLKDIQQMVMNHLSHTVFLISASHFNQETKD